MRSYVLTYMYQAKLFDVQHPNDKLNEPRCLGEQDFFFSF